MKTLKKLFVALTVIGLAFTIIACNSVQTQTPTGDNVGSFGSYENLQNYLTQYLNDVENNYYTATTTALAGAETDASADQQDSPTSKEYSQTNNQVEGVDEGDKILTNGNEIFVLSGAKIFIVDADSLDIIFTYTFTDGYFNNMYIYGDSLVLVGAYNHYFYWGWYEDYTKDDEGSDETNSSDATTMVGDETLDPDVTTVKPDDTTTTNSDDDTISKTTAEEPEYKYGTRIVVFDISDLSDVTIERELYFEAASITQTRMIDGYIYLIMNNYMISYYNYTDSYIPRYKDSAISDEYINVPANQIYFMPEGSNNYSYLQLVSFNVTDDSPISIKAYLGYTYQIYMSLNNLYTVGYNWNYDQETNIYTSSTFILRFAIADNQLVYKALGTIQGYPLNQFSMDEYNGVFRIATTDFQYIDNQQQITNQLYLLDATSENKMTQISELSGLGKPNERIFAVRYDEDYAYVVTFEQTDPLYKLDLSDPTDPVILGGLEEEGVSDYLHKISDNLMIGIGRSAETSDEWTWLNGVKVSLYDITGDEPVNLQNYFVGGDYSFSNVTYDHKAFVYFKPSSADFTYVAIPVYEYFANEQYFKYSQSEYVFKVFDSGTLESVARLSHIGDTDENSYTYYDTIERAVFIDNYIYTISYSRIQKYDMNDDFKVINSAELNQDYYYIYGYPVGVATDAVGVAD